MIGMAVFIITFFALIASYFAILFLTRERQALPPAKDPRRFDVPPVYHSIFEPTDEEIRALETEEKRQLTANQAEETRLIAEQNLAEIYDYRKVWRESPDARTTAELLRRAAENGNAAVFAEIAESVIKLSRENEINNLSARDLAELLDSHFRLLPQQERTSGAIFRLKEEIAELRLKSEG